MVYSDALSSDETPLAMSEAEAGSLSRIFETPRSLCVLLTNWSLQWRGGTECFIRDVALGLRARDHRPLVYAPRLGPLADEIAAAGIPVVDDLCRIGDQPDIIHAQHFIPAGEALSHFPASAAIYFCHGWTPRPERPLRFPQIRRYVAISECTRDHIVNREGIDPQRTIYLPHAVDLSRIPPRPQALSSHPRRATAFLSRAHAPIFPILEAACQAHGIRFSAIGMDRDEVDPQTKLHGCDIVFATGRSALEALAAGCATIICDANGLAGLVTTQSYPYLRRHNFALRALIYPVNVARVAEAISRYDACDAEAISARLRVEANFDTYLDHLLALYHEAIAEQKQTPMEETHLRAARQRFLHEALPDDPFAHQEAPVLPYALAQNIAALTRELRSDEAHRAELAAALAKMQSTIEAEREKLAEERNAHEQAVASREAALHALALRLDAAEEARAAAELAYAQEHLAHETWRDAIHRSRSWRLTKPMRWVAAHCRAR